MTNLLPCPFCGGEAEVYPSNEWDVSLTGKTFFIWCDRCETRGDYYNTEAEAAEAWNTRTERMCRFVGHSWENVPTCSSCGYEAGWDECADYGDDVYEYLGKYCPQCGAKVVDE